MFNAEFRLKCYGNGIICTPKAIQQTLYFIVCSQRTSSGYDNYVGTFKLNYDNRWEDKIRLDFL